MNDIIIKIFFKDGHEEQVECFLFEVKDNVLKIQKIYAETVCYPLDFIKKYEVFN